MSDDTSVDDPDDHGFEWGTGGDDPDDGDATAGSRSAREPDGASGPAAVDDDVRETVERDLAELAEDESDDFPSADDPVAPQSIDAENAAFVVLGVLATVGLVAFLVLSV